MNEGDPALGCERENIDRLDGFAPVDRVTPHVSVGQWVLSLPFELRRLVAFRADMLTAIACIVYETVSADTISISLTRFTAPASPTALRAGPVKSTSSAWVSF